MITADYRLTTRSRVSVGKGPEVTFSREAQAVISGGTIRGALAAAYCRDHGFDWTSPRLRDLFERHAWFSQARPVHWELDGMSTVRCKYPKDDECRRAARDLALIVADDREQIPSRCPACRGAWSQGKGWRKPAGDRDPIVATIRTQLEGGVAKEENLFTRRALETGTELTGTIRIDESVDPESLRWLESEHDLRVGGQRSVLGAARWSTQRGEPAPDHGPLPPRVVLRCLSPMIVVDDHGAATLDPGLMLRRRLGDQLTVVARWTRPVRVAGWHMASGLPKPEDWALDAGSTFVVEGAPSGLADLLADGLGLRRREGYGAVTIVDQPPTPPRTEPEPALATREQIQVLVAAHGGPDKIAGGDVDLPPEQGEDEPEPALTEDESRLRSIAEIVGAIGAQAQVTPKAGVNGLLGALTQVRIYRQNGFPTSIVANLVRTAIQTPWARALPPAITAQVSELLGDTDDATLAASHADVRRIAQERGYI